jgi:energy-coupling factor transporter ATP-binding protein EcfA2
MTSAIGQITSLPTRYEPLVRVLGDDKAKTTFVPCEEDLERAKRLIASSESAGQGKFCFLEAPSGSGKSTFVHSLEIFMSDKVGEVVRLPPPHELKLSDIPAYIAALKRGKKFTVVNFDNREAPFFNPPEYQTFLGELNGILRSRPDILVYWRVTDKEFAAALVALLEKVGGKSAFGPAAVQTMVGLRKDQYFQVLGKLLQVANWQLEDAAIDRKEAQELVSECQSIGVYLEKLHSLIVSRFDVGGMGVRFPELIVVVGSSDLKLRETCRSLRRADSFYVEASRLLMYTKRSNVAEWWSNRAQDLKSALPHVIALLNVQLVSISASTVVHSVLRFGAADLKSLVQGVREDKGNARKIIKASELYRLCQGGGTDYRDYGSNVSDRTIESYGRIQAASELKHKDINEAVVAMLRDAELDLEKLKLEAVLTPGLQSDASYDGPDGKIALEFHYKTGQESTNNKIAIYVLEKIKEYAINFGLAQR